MYYKVSWEVLNINKTDSQPKYLNPGWRIVSECRLEQTLANLLCQLDTGKIHVTELKEGKTFGVKKRKPYLLIKA